MVSHKKRKNKSKNKTKRTKMKGGEPLSEKEALRHLKDAIEAHKMDWATAIVENEQYKKLVNTEMKIKIAVYFYPINLAISTYFIELYRNDSSDTDMITLLLDNGADITVFDRGGSSILHYITKPINSNLQSFEQSFEYHILLINLLKSYIPSKSDESGKTEQEILTILNSPNHSGFSPTHSVIQQLSSTRYNPFPNENAIDYLTYLIDDFKPDLNIPVLNNGNTPLHTICNFKRDSIFYDIDQIPSPHPDDFFDDTSYRESLNAYNDKLKKRKKIIIDIVKLIIDNTENVNVQNNYKRLGKGYTPFHHISALLIQEIKDEITQLLITKGREPVALIDILKIYDLLEHEPPPVGSMRIDDDFQFRPIKGIEFSLDTAQEIYDVITMEEKTIEQHINESPNNIVLIYPNDSEDDTTIFVSYDDIANYLINFSYIVYECKQTSRAFRQPDTNLVKYTNNQKVLFYNMQAFGINGTIVPLGQLLKLLESIEHQRTINENKNQIYILQNIKTENIPLVSLAVQKGGNVSGANHCQDTIPINKCELFYRKNEDDSKNEIYKNEEDDTPISITMTMDELNVPIARTNSRSNSIDSSILGTDSTYSIPPISPPNSPPDSPPYDPNSPLTIAAISPIDNINNSVHDEEIYNRYNDIIVDSDDISLGDEITDNMADNMEPNEYGWTFIRDGQPRRTTDTIPPISPNHRELTPIPPPSPLPVEISRSSSTSPFNEGGKKKKKKQRKTKKKQRTKKNNKKRRKTKKK